MSEATAAFEPGSLPGDLETLIERRGGLRARQFTREEWGRAAIEALERDPAAFDIIESPHARFPWNDAMLEALRPLSGVSVLHLGPWLSLSIEVDGAAYACPIALSAKLSMGNLSDQTLDEIWNGHQAGAIRRFLTGRGPSNGLPCAKCRMYGPTAAVTPTKTRKLPVVACES